MNAKYLRFADLVERQIVGNRTTLSRWTKEHGFPPGILLGANTRAWPEDEVEAWLEARPQKRADASLVRAAEAYDQEAEEGHAAKDGDEPEEEAEAA